MKIILVFLSLLSFNLFAYDTIECSGKFYSLDKIMTESRADLGKLREDKPIMQSEPIDFIFRSYL